MWKYIGLCYIYNKQADNSMKICFLSLFHPLNINLENEIKMAPRTEKTINKGGAAVLQFG